MATPTNPDQSVLFLVIPATLKAQLQLRAKRQRRSMNAEAIIRLTKSMKEEEPTWTKR